MTDYFTFLDFSIFSKNDNAFDDSDLNYDRLWKLRHIFNFLNAKYSKYYNLLKGRKIFKKCISEGQICFGIELYKL
jgi:hypothetical protein